MGGKPHPASGHVSTWSGKVVSTLFVALDGFRLAQKCSLGCNSGREACSSSSQTVSCFLHRLGSTALGKKGAAASSIVDARRESADLENKLAPLLETGPS